MSLKMVSKLVFVMILAASFEVMADKPENLTSWSTTLGGDTWSSIIPYVWDYSGDEPVWNSRKYKRGQMSHPFPGGPEYIIVESSATGSVDPRLYYRNNSTWYSLSDDEGSGYNFRAVIHFNGATPSVYGELLYTHYSTSDVGDYQLSHTILDYDPVEHGCYYLEIYADGTITKQWHN